MDNESSLRQAECWSPAGADSGEEWWLAKHWTSINNSAVETDNTKKYSSDNTQQPEDCYHSSRQNNQMRGDWRTKVFMLRLMSLIEGR